MKNLLRQTLDLLVVGGQLMMTLYFPWLLWRDDIIEVWHALLRITVPVATQAVVSGAVIALAIFALEKRWAWLKETVYWVLAPLFKGYASRMRSVEPSWGMHPATMFFFMQHTVTSDHWLVAKLERWLMQATSLLFWPLVCVLLSGLVFRTNEKMWVAAIVFAMLLLVLSALAVRIRYILAIVLLLAWLSYVYDTQGGYEATDAQAVVVGLCLALWGLWQRWQDKISETPPPPAPPESEPA